MARAPARHAGGRWFESNTAHFQALAIKGFVRNHSTASSPRRANSWANLLDRLVGALYVLDEPTIGLHQRDNERLVKTLQELRDLGNSVLVVEHDEDTIRASDFMVELGPGAGEDF